MMVTVLCLNGDHYTRHTLDIVLGWYTHRFYSTVYNKYFTGSICTAAHSMANKTLTDSVAGDGHSRTTKMTTISYLRFHLISISIVFEW